MVTTGGGEPLTNPNASLDEHQGRVVAGIDLGAAVAFFLACSLAEPTLDPVLRLGHGLSGVLMSAGYQFACEGLALVVIMVLRGERPSSYGFTKRRIGTSLGLALVLAAIYDLALSWHKGALLWVPLLRQPATRMAIGARFPASGVGLAITIAAWGVFEGFFGVFFARKLDRALGRDGRGWFSVGAIGFAVFNGLIHLAVGQGPQGFIWSLASGYAIAVIQAVTGNAWGSALVQTLTNAVGRP